MLSYSSYDHHDPDLCACGCKTPVAYEGLEPRFASIACRDRWVGKLVILPCDPELAVLDDGPQEPPPAAEPVPVEEVAEVREEFVQRLTVAPQVEAALHTLPSGMRVKPGPRSLWRFFARKVR